MSRCDRCGFLAMRNIKTGDLLPVDFESRQSGRFATLLINSVIEPFPPRCFVMQDELANAVAAQKTESNTVLLAIQTEHACPAFIEWHQGFSPKEHKNMLFDLEAKRLALQEKESERKWQSERESREQRFQLLNTLVSVLVGATVTALFAWLANRK